MVHVSAAFLIFWVPQAVVGVGHAHKDSGKKYKIACPAYQSYAETPHHPYSEGPLALPFQRPAKQCRTFTSTAVEQVITDITTRMTDADMARLFENAYPNTLDTTISWHVDGSVPIKKRNHSQHIYKRPDDWDGAQSFIVTGDITAEWLRDSTNQLQGYQALASKDPALDKLILGAINTQAEYVFQSPYCNAFQPPPPSGLNSAHSSADMVHPAYDGSFVFECKYELDSLAHFLRLGNEYYDHTKSTAFLTPRWFAALESLMTVVVEQSIPTFNDTTGEYNSNAYRFQRHTTTSTETLGLHGLGNPLNGGTGLVRSAFRPSDDSTILPYFIPSNAMMSVELRRTAALLKMAGKEEWGAILDKWSETIKAGILEHGVVKHKKYGNVFAFEVDGYGSHILMDDANLPSLLALPLLGFVDKSDQVYQNTRKMILEQKGNPYFLTGSEFSGIGGPHIGLKHAWPMSRLVQAMTSSDDEEIIHSLNMVKNASRLGLIHESINVELAGDYTRSWFAWANSVFAQTILQVAAEKPHLIFGKGAKPYRAGE